MTYSALIRHGVTRTHLFAVVSCVVCSQVCAAKEPIAIAKKGVAPAPLNGVVAVKIDGGYMVPYTETIPGTNVKFEMIPIPGGEFLMGSPAEEANRKVDEGPQVRVKVEPFWMGKCEVTWAEYRAYMAMYDAFRKMQRIASNAAANRDIADTDKDLELIKAHAWNHKLEIDWNVDAVTSPTPVYDARFTFAAGDQPNQPAVTMSQFAARQYTKWLSGILGDDYRLPTEAEWEYAARAGTTTPWSFGSDARDLEKHAWVDTNSKDHTHAVGTKEPNPWGLHDIHGNVDEWTLDEYVPNKYAKLGSRAVEAKGAVEWPTKLFPRVIRGGSWLEPAAMSRSAARHKSDDREWLSSDADLPQSAWWFTEEPATAVGMRILRPLQRLSVNDRKRVWNPDIDKTRDDVTDSSRQGRGKIGVADPTLPAAVKATEKLDKGY